MDEHDLSFEVAFQVAQASQMFTTHTPVPAGIDLFPADKVLHYLGQYRDRFALSDDEFLALGRTDTGDLSAPFSMAVLAIKNRHLCQRGEQTPCPGISGNVWQPVAGTAPQRSAHPRHYQRGCMAAVA